MTPANIGDLRARARRNMPRMFFDYLDGGAFSESALRRNQSDFDALRLEQRVLVDIARRDLRTEILGSRYDLPMMLGPVGFSGMFWPFGEVEVAKAAAAQKIPMCLSAFSICSIEEVAAYLPRGDLAFQLYVFRDRSLVRDLLDRARNAGIRTLFVTVDTDVSSIRERDTRNGFRTAERLNLTALAGIARHPRWCLRMAKVGSPQLGNVRGRPDVGAGLMAQAKYLSANVDPSLSWKDIAWLREQWEGRLVFKGILSVHDALKAAEIGVETLLVSNHGGRQLDDARSSVSVLPEIVDAIGGRAEILVDGGVRRGSHVVKALALGADAVVLGRAYAYGLGAAGRKGVLDALDLLKTEFDITLALMGFSSIAGLRASGRAVLASSAAVPRIEPAEGARAAR